MPSNCVALFTRQQTPSLARMRPPRFRILIHHSLCSNPSLALTRILSYINHTHGLAYLQKKGFQVIIYHISAEPLSPKTNNDCGGNLLIQAFSSLPLFTILLRNCNASPSSPMRQWAERGIEITAYHSLSPSRSSLVVVVAAQRRE